MSESTLNISTGQVRANAARPDLATLRERLATACRQRLGRYGLPEQFARVPHVKRHPNGKAADYRSPNSVVQEAQS